MLCPQLCFVDVLMQINRHAGGNGLSVVSTLSRWDEAS